MSDWLIPLLSTVLIVGLSAFFVIIEFSLLAARRHRLEESAETSTSSRLSLKNLNELTVMLAGAQLGITACTFALGAVSKPAVEYALQPVLNDFLPGWAAGVISFVVALFTMTFLHLVVGEMAPKSWAIAHPELSAKVVAIPARIYIFFFKPILVGINNFANRLVAATGVEPVDRAAAGGYDSDTLRSLVEHSTLSGTLDEASATQIASIMDLEKLTVRDAIGSKQRSSLISLPDTSSSADVQALAKKTGHLRVLIGPLEDQPRIIHVRDTLNTAAETPVANLAREALVVSDTASIYETFQRMRHAGEQLAVVKAETGFVGVLSWNDILGRVWPSVETQVKTAG